MTPVYFKILLESDHVSLIKGRTKHAPVFILFLVILYGDSSVNISFLNFTAEVPLHPLSIFLCFAHTLNPENVVFLFTL